MEIFSYVRIWFYERETRDLVRINQCDLIESFFGAQRDYASELVLALASEVTEAVLGEREVAEPNFRLLLVTGRAIKAGADHRIVSRLFRFVDCDGWAVGFRAWTVAASAARRSQAADIFLMGRDSVRRLPRAGAHVLFQWNIRIGFTNARQINWMNS